MKKYSKAILMMDIGHVHVYFANFRPTGKVGRVNVFFSFEDWTLMYRSMNVQYRIQIHECPI